MSTGPKAYSPTNANPKIGQVPKNLVYYNNGVTAYVISKELWENFANQYQYIKPAINSLDITYQLRNVDGLTYSITYDDIIDYLNRVPEGKKAIALRAWDSPWYLPSYFEDLLGFTYYNNTLIYPLKSNWYNNVGVTGYYYTPWPFNGISLYSEVVTNLLTSFKNQGITIDYIMNDIEGNPLENSWSIAGAINMLQSTTYWNEAHFGISSAADLYQLYGNQGAWHQFVSAFEASWLRTAIYNTAKTIYPDIITYNYMNYISDPAPLKESEENVAYIDGAKYPERGNAGNAPSPVLYGESRNFTRGKIYSSHSLGSGLISYTNPYVVVGGLSGRDYRMIPGPWYSFLTSISTIKTCKRNSYNSPMMPWIGSVYMAYDAGMWAYTTYVGSNISPPQVLHNTWYKPNIASIVTGITGPSGATTAFRITTTSGASLDASVELYYIGLTEGITYNFSYYINLNSGFTGSEIKIRNFYENNVGAVFPSPFFNGITKGITFNQLLPSATGPFVGNSSIFYNPGDSGWTQVKWSFILSGNTSLSIALYSGLNSASGGNRIINLAEPKLEQESPNINFPVRSLLQEPLYGWREAPSIGYCHTNLGEDRRSGVYYTERPGNSAYYYELIRHCCLLGTKSFNGFFASTFVDNGITGTITNGSVFGSVPTELYLLSGSTTYIDEFNTLNNVISDVHSKIGGFTLTTANVGPINWSLPYVANGAPDTKGQTWWWRVTVKPGYTMNCHGMTLSTAPGYPVGSWVPLRSSDIRMIENGLTWSEWARTTLSVYGVSNPNEPTLPTPSKNINFMGMCSASDLTSSGCSFTRGSSASYIDSQGRLIVVGPNQPRFTYDPKTLEPKGLLIEYEGYNHLNWSESFASTGGSKNNWIDTNISRSSGHTSPSGFTNAIRFTATENDATIISTTSIGSTYARSFSVWVRGFTGYEDVYYTINGGSSWNYIAKVSDKWQRFEFGPYYPLPDYALGKYHVPCYYGVTALDHKVGLKIGNKNDVVEIWGAQLEDRQPYSYISFAEFWNWRYPQCRSYIPTAGTTGYRSSDIITIEPSSTTGWLGLTFSIVYESENSFGSFMIRRDTTNDYVIATTRDDQNIISYRYINPSATHYLSPTNSFANGARSPISKTAIVFTGLTFGMYNEGVGNSIIHGFTGQTLPFTRIYLALDRNSTFPYNRPDDITYLRQFRYWNEILPENDIKQTTATYVDPYKWILNPHG